MIVDECFKEVESEGWKKRHPLGPVHCDVVCLCCGKNVAEDLPYFCYIGKKEFVANVCAPHLAMHLMEFVESISKSPDDSAPCRKDSRLTPAIP